MPPGRCPGEHVFFCPYERLPLEFNSLTLWSVGAAAHSMVMWV